MPEKVQKTSWSNCENYMDLPSTNLKSQDPNGRKRVSKISFSNMLKKFKKRKESAQYKPFWRYSTQILSISKMSEVSGTKLLVFNV